MEAIRRHKAALFTLLGREEIGEQQKERALLILEWQHIISIIITCLDKITTRETNGVTSLWITFRGYVKSEQWRMVRGDVGPGGFQG